MIAHPVNPSSTEIREWAYDAAAPEPDQDFHLVLARVRHEKEYLEFVSDPHCPKRWYFLDILYLIVGDAVRYEYKSLPEPILRGFLSLAERYPDKSVQLWRERSLDLMRNPKSFDFKAWCGGGYAKAAT